MAQLVQTVKEVRQHVAAARAEGKRIGFVPTMGALHEGHGSLIDRARRECDYVVVSIFVNPLQFGPSEDFDRYPRDLPGDMAFCRKRGVDLVFAPSVEEMYPRKQLTFVQVEELTEGLCGASRPGHFRGVTTVVAKLFNIVLPDRAYFGQKDFQQAVVVRRMAEDLLFPLDVVVVPTVREPDGLALSSRNAYLKGEERRAALVLYRALQRAEERLRDGVRDAKALRDELAELINAEPLARIDYVELVDPETLRPLERIQDRALVALAVYVGQTRLIDNLLWQAESRE